MDYIIREHRSRPQNRVYFSKEAEHAIIKYNNTKDVNLKSKIYEKHIHYPFFKLTQNIIHTFKFYYTDVDNLEDLQHEIITFLLDRIHMYSHKQNIQDKLTKIITKEFGEEYDKNFVKYIGKADIVKQTQIDKFISKLDVSDECLEKLSKIKPPKAYSYFGTIVKNFLIVYNEKNYKNKKQNIQVSDLNEYSNLNIYNPLFISSLRMEGEINSIKDEGEFEGEDLKLKGYKYGDKLSNFVDQYIVYCSKNLTTLFPKPYDAQIADAVLELFRKRENIEIFNKKALYIYLREMVPGVKTPKLTKISKKMYVIFKEKYHFYLEHNYFPS